MKKDSRKYKGWNFRTLENKWVKLHLAPKFGGRIIQFEMDGYEFFFNNTNLLGKKPDQTCLGNNGIWLNFGGEKIWPAPQGWNSPDHWPGPPDPVIDSGVYSIAKFTGDAEENILTMTSPIDQFTGLQIKKEVILVESSSEVTVHATFCNKSHVLKKWSIWPVLQMNTYFTGVENQYRIVCPVNPESKFNNGFKVIHGLVNNPQFLINCNGNIVVHYQYLVGKIGLDTNSNWAAYIDTLSGKVFVLKFQCQEDKPYPEDTCFQVWTSGKGIVYSRNIIKEYKDDKDLNPPYMEMELLSPLQTIQPGESIQFEYRMLTCTIPENEEVRTVNDFGVIANPLSILSVKDGILITGKYGVFSNGTLKLKLNTKLYECAVTPLEGINIVFKICEEEREACKNVCLSLDLYDQTGQFVGTLDEIII